MSKTKERLNESHFFLKEFNENYFNQPQCVYFLNAFIASSRSVLWIMRNEYGKIDGWKEWYELKQPKKEEKDFLKKITVLRNRSQKREPIKPDFQIQIQIKNTPPKIEKRLKELLGKKVNVEISTEKSEIVDKPEVTKKAIAFTGKIDHLKGIVPEFPEDDILLVCRKYYSLLELLVSECEKKFRKTM